jgi:hypothetical protein
MSPGAIEGRLREVSRIAGSLRPEDRLQGKLDLRPEAVTRRLREASDLLTLCQALSAAPPSLGMDVPFLHSKAK